MKILVGHTSAPEGLAALLDAIGAATQEVKTGPGAER